MTASAELVERVLTGDLSEFPPGVIIDVPDMADDDLIIPFAEKFISLADLVKVGPEGYIHGYICVRPPCGPKYAQHELDKKKGQVLHNGEKIGRVPSKDADGKYSAVHIARGADGTEVRTKLPARFATPQQAFAAIPVYHDVKLLHEHSAGTAAEEHLSAARSAIASGDMSAAVSHLRSAADSARANGNESLATHIEHVHAEVADLPGVEPKLTASTAVSAPAHAPAPAKTSLPPVADKPPGGDLPVPAAQPDTTPASPSVPVIPAAPKRTVSHTDLDAKAISDRLHQIYQESREIPGLASYRSPFNNIDYAARQITGKNTAALYPTEPLPGEHAPAKILSSIDNDIERANYLIKHGKGQYDYADEKITPAIKAKLTELRDRLQVIRNEIAAADTSSPFVPGEYVSGTHDQLSGGFTDHLSDVDSSRITQLIADTRLSYPEDSIDDGRLNGLKSTFITRALQAAGLPLNAARHIAEHGVGDMMFSWSVSGDQAQKISADYLRSMSMTAPPPLSVTDFAGRQDTHGLGDERWAFSDMSPEAAERRRLAMDYWTFRAQQHYTNQVLSATKQESKPIKIVRYVYGPYAKNILSANSSGTPWQASSRLLSSWAEPKGATTAKSFVKSFADSKDNMVRLEQTIDPSQVFVHWRGEGILRNGVRVKGEIITRDAQISHENTTVKTVT